MNQYTVSYTPKDEKKPTWVTDVLANNVHEALVIGKGMYAKTGNAVGGTFEASEEFL